MILEEIPKKPNGNIKTSAKVLCRCSCGTEFRRLVLKAIEGTICRSCTTREMNLSRTPEQKAALIEAAAKVWRGKKREEVMGVERREIERKAQSLRNSGVNNPNFNGKYCKGFAENPLFGKWEERYGVDKANSMREACSVRNSGANNPMYGKPTPEKSGNGISGWWNKKLYFRSLLELGFILECERAGLKISSAERGKYRVNYIWLGAERTYTPDFVDEFGTLYEIKPNSLSESAQVQAKKAAAPQVLMVTENEIHRPTLSELKLLIESKIVTIDKSKEWRIK